MASVVSMSKRHANGDDAAYLEWHMLDHLPEQYRLAGLRFGQRFVSTPGCRAARAASSPPYDDVDHIVQYLFAEPLQPTLDAFFSLGGALRGINRMPTSLPSVQVGGWDLDGAMAAERVLVGAAVLPWRPATGAYILVESAAPGRRPSVSDTLARLAEVPGVAGAWAWSGSEPRHDRLQTTAGCDLTICYLDDDPLDVAGAIDAVLDERWSARGVTPLLAAPFELVVPGEWNRHLP